MVFPGTHWIWSNIFFYFNPDKWFTRMGAEVSGLLEAISKLGFSMEISRQRSAGQEGKAEDQPTPLVNGIFDMHTQVCRGLETRA
jgi:hypothetical protein